MVEGRSVRALSAIVEREANPGLSHLQLGCVHANDYGRFNRDCLSIYICTLPKVEFTIGKAPRGGIERKTQSILDEVKASAKGKKLVSAIDRMDT